MSILPCLISTQVQDVCEFQQMVRRTQNALQRFRAFLCALQVERILMQHTPSSQNDRSQWRAQLVRISQELRLQLLTYADAHSCAWLSLNSRAFSMPGTDCEASILQKFYDIQGAN